MTQEEQQQIAKSSLEFELWALCTKQDLFGIMDKHNGEDIAIKLIDNKEEFKKILDKL